MKRRHIEDRLLIYLLSFTCYMDIYAGCLLARRTIFSMQISSSHGPIFFSEYELYSVVIVVVIADGEVSHGLDIMLYINNILF